jgi:NAD+ kinase
VLGVNSGRLGFLAPVPIRGMCEALDRWVAGEFSIEERSLLAATVAGRPAHHLALNDVVVHKGVDFSLIRLEVLVDGQPAGSFDGDGVVIATPTGSTGYTLSLGGPILRPDVRAIALTPLNPHSLFNRALVLPETARVVIRLPQESALLTCDGQVNESLPAGTEVQVALAENRARLVRVAPEPDFFSMLRQKLRWGLPLIDGEA